MTMALPDPPEVESFRNTYLQVCQDVMSGAILAEDLPGLDPTGLYMHFSNPEAMATASAFKSHASCWLPIVAFTKAFWRRPTKLPLG
jgi:hypothetical protein